MKKFNRELVLSRINIPFDATNNECWEWIGHYNSMGRGTYSKHNANRVVYMLFVGTIPKDELLCHKCDNIKCVNPHHMFIGDQSDNILDCSKKGRHISNQLKWLSQDEVNLLFKLRREGSSFVRIGRKLELSPQRCGAIFNGHTSYKETISSC